jgi:hypothetical protein
MKANLRTGQCDCVIKKNALYSQNSAALKPAAKFANQLTTPGDNLAAVLILVLGISVG